MWVITKSQCETLNCTLDHIKVTRTKKLDSRSMDIDRNSKPDTTTFVVGNKLTQDNRTSFESTLIQNRN